MADLSWAVKKTINDKKVIILVDYYGNGRLIIDDMCIMVYDGCFQHGNRLLKYGWTFCTEKDDPEAIIQRGNYKGGVHMCDKLGDVVQVKGIPGPKMTVSRIQSDSDDEFFNENLQCLWFDTNAILYKETFHCDILEHVFIRR